MKSTTILFLILSLNLAVISQWQQTGSIPPGGGITDMVVTQTGAIIVTAASFNFPSGQMGGIRRSSDGGNTWQSPINYYTARTLALGQGNNSIYASAWNYPNNNEGLYRSDNDGVTWGNIYFLGTDNNIFTILPVTSSTIYIGTRNGVLKSGNGGASFSSVNSGIPANSWVRDLAFAPGYIAAATTNGVFISTNAGTSWQLATGIPSNDTVTTLDFVSVETGGDALQLRLNAGSNSGYIYEAALASLYSNFFVLVYFLQTSIVKLYHHYVSSFSRRYALGRRMWRDSPVDPSVFVSTDNGANWTAQNEGLPVDPLVSAIAGPVPGGNSIDVYLGMFGSTNNGGVIYKRTYPIGIHQISTEMPGGFSLSQNFPNPFNPSTTIKFSLPSDSKVKLAIFNSSGQEVASLVNEEMNAGAYEYQFDASKLSSGVYFYKLITDGFSDTKKMILVK